MVQIIRCSKLARPMTCAGSLYFTDLIEEENDAAKEGTACGEMLAHKLLNRSYGTHASNGVPFNADMEFYTKEIAEEILAVAGPNNVVCETKVDWPTSGGIRIQGSSDISYVIGDDLYIEDLKYGWVLVEVQENWQLLGYAIGEVIRRKKAFKNIIMRIRQPRPHHEDGPTREWKLTYSELLDYKKRIDDRMAEIANGDQTLRTGPQCKYCPAATKCAALNKAFYLGVDYVHHFVQDEISDEVLSQQLDLAKRVMELAKIKYDSLEQLAKNRMASGIVIPNYVMETQWGNREWTELATPELIKLMCGLDVVKQEMLSPRQAEIMKVPKEIVEALTKKEFKGQKLKRKDHSQLGEKIFGKRG